MKEEEVVDKLGGIERAEYYRTRYLSRGTLIIIFSILFFIIGFLVARVIYMND